MYLTKRLYRLKRIYVKVYNALYGYCIIEIIAIPVNIFLFKFSNKNTRKCCELCSELAIKTLKRRPFRVFLLWTLNK